MTSERREGKRRTMRPSGSEGSRLGRVSAGTASAGTFRTSPLHLKLLQVGQRDIAEEFDLVLEHDAELLVSAPPRLGHELESIGCGRTAGVLDEVGVLRGDARAADPVAPQAARIEH